MGDLENMLTKIENLPEGPACLVTIGTGQKRFATGMDLAYWDEGALSPLTSLPRL